MERVTLFADVILPLAVPNYYTYRLPFELNNVVKPGQRVVVQLGKTKRYSAIIRKIHSSPPVKYEARYLESVLDEIPLVTEHQMKLWEWMADYYMCTVGEVMTAALPSALKLSSETKVVKNADLPVEEYEKLKQELTDREYVLMEALEMQEVLSLDDVQKIVDIKTVYPIIKSLLQKKLIITQEEVKEKYKPKTDIFIALETKFHDENNLRQIIEQLEKKAHKQLEALLAVLHLLNKENKPTNNYTGEVARKDVLSMVEGADTAIKGLEKKGILVLAEREVGRIKADKSVTRTFTFTPLQQQVYQTINEQLNEKQVVVLQGVTSSGKTELYIRLIEQVIKEGKQVLYLLPEIALTTQIINRLRKHFGEKVGVYHSRFNDNERVEIWNRLLYFGEENKLSSYNVVIGARSSIFLPFKNLGLIIVDEEHDSSFKQYDPAPRYQARDVAVYLAGQSGAKTILGSATPSLESYYNATTGKYGFAYLGERFGGMEMPDIQVADIKEAKKKRLMKSHFSPLLLEQMEKALKQKEQIILFQNRRGFAPILECDSCAWVPQCVHCDVSLTYHKSLNLLRCHYCGYSLQPPSVCGACGDTRLTFKGFGTEKIEEDLSVFFPNARVRRMDLDTTRSKYAYSQIIHDFEEQHIDILVGTQMITKGLDFDHVSVVGILNADSMLSYPDFRSFERAYQLMAQVSGRAGRKNKRGTVIIQTHQPEHEIIKYVMENNYLAMYESQLKERKGYLYPPFCRLVYITLKHKDVTVLDNAALDLVTVLKKNFGNHILGPEYPPVSRVRNFFLKNIVIKLSSAVAVSAQKENIKNAIHSIRTREEYRSVVVVTDVDPT